MNTHLQYMPTFRLRSEEIQAVSTCSNLLGSKLVPLFEIITPTPPHRRGTFQDSHHRLLGTFDFKFFIDVPSHIIIRGSIKPEARDFLLPIKRSRLIVMNHLQQLAGIPNLVPVLSHDPTVRYVPGTFVGETTTLRTHFGELGFRIQHSQMNMAAMITDLLQVLQPGEVVILDADASLPTNTALNTAKADLDRVAVATNCKKVFLRSAIPEGLTNVGLTHGAPVATIDSGHVRTYSTSGYDVFGDYCGVRKELPKTGGQISPGLLYYFWNSNRYLGFRGNAADVDEFRRTIVPDLLSTGEWGALNPSHLANCPGCQYVHDVRAAREEGRSQAMWKRVSMMHYMHTMHAHL